MLLYPENLEGDSAKAAKKNHLFLQLKPEAIHPIPAKIEFLRERVDKKLELPRVLTRGGMNLT